MLSLTWLTTTVSTTRFVRRLHRADDRGEGVISAAIAVLVIASVGALMWVGFQQLWGSTRDRTAEQIDQIGG